MLIWLWIIEDVIYDRRNWNERIVQFSKSCFQLSLWFSSWLKFFRFLFIDSLIFIRFPNVSHFVIRLSTVAWNWWKRISWNGKKNRYKCNITTETDRDNAIVVHFKEPMLHETCGPCSHFSFKVLAYEILIIIIIDDNKKKWRSIL